MEETINPLGIVLVVFMMVMVVAGLSKLELWFGVRKIERRMERKKREREKL
tara:strand:- start:345 stop:497 length:153 start_codon:yes stop_codon:yes gene_type:complete